MAKKSGPPVEKATTPAPLPKAKKVAKKAVEREVKYPEVKVEVYRGENALIAHDAMAMLGWEVIPEAEGRDAHYILTDIEGNKIRCTNNDHNRPFDEEWAKTLGWDLLNGHWRFNGESIIIGKTGRVSSGQHRLIAFVLATQRYYKDKAHWEKINPKPPALETVVVYGIDESLDVTRTLDNVKKRTVGDVIYTDPRFFSVMDGKPVPPKDRKMVTRMLESCVRQLWARTRAKEQPFSPRYTHSEVLDFIDRHPHMIEAVATVYKINMRPKDDKGKLGAEPIGELFSPGYAAALLYLMGSSSSDIDAYVDPDKVRAEVRGKEEVLSWDNWDRAVQFWRAFATSRTDVGQLKGLRKALVRIQNEDVEEVRDENTGELVEVEGGTSATYAEAASVRQLALIAKAWERFAAGESVEEEEDIQPEVVLDQHGIHHLAENPLFGGIDQGNETLEKKVAKLQNPEVNGTAEDPSEEQIEEMKDVIREENFPAVDEGEEAGGDEDQELEDEEEVEKAASQKPIKRKR